jgi:hypothetical protein
MQRCEWFQLPVDTVACVVVGKVPDALYMKDGANTVVLRIPTLHSPLISLTDCPDSSQDVRHQRQDQCLQSYPCHFRRVGYIRYCLWTCDNRINIWTTKLCGCYIILSINR